MTHESNTQALSFPPPKHKGQKQYRLKLFIFHNTVFVKRNNYYCHVCPSVYMDEHHSAILKPYSGSCAGAPAFYLSVIQRPPMIDLLLGPIFALPSALIVLPEPCTIQCSPLHFLLCISPHLSVSHH